MLTLIGCHSCSLFFLSGVRLHLVDKFASLEYEDIQVWNGIVPFVFMKFGSLVFPFLILTAIDTAENSHFRKPEGRIIYLKNIEAELTQFYQRNVWKTSKSELQLLIQRASFSEPTGIIRLYQNVSYFLKFFFIHLMQKLNLIERRGVNIHDREAILAHSGY